MCGVLTAWLIEVHLMISAIHWFLLRWTNVLVDNNVLRSPSSSEKSLHCKHWFCKWFNEKMMAEILWFLSLLFRCKPSKFRSSSQNSNVVKRASASVSWVQRLQRDFYTSNKCHIVVNFHYFHSIYKNVFPSSPPPRAHAARLWKVSGAKRREQSHSNSFTRALSSHTWKLK